MTKAPKHRFTGLHSGNVLFQAHVRDDSRFVLLAVVPPGTINGWTIYDAEQGVIISPELFKNITEAKQWLDKEFPE